MRGTPYVSRGKSWQRSLENGTSVLTQDNTIVIGERTLDGIDRPDYSAKFKLTPDEARYIATELWKLAEEIDGKTKKTSTLKAIRSNTQKIAEAAKREANA